MKGTLFSADFVKDSNGDLRLLELNTDTSFTSGALHHVDFTDFINVLSTNNIDEVHVIYKGMHTNFVTELSQSLSTSGVISTFSETTENGNTIYPTSVEDSENKFILRLAYDESAIFDSTYCKQKDELLRLFHSNADTNSIPEFYISSSESQIDLLTRTSNIQTAPDVVVKDVVNVHDELEFYKIAGTGSTEENFDAMLSSLPSDKLVIKYYNDESHSKHKSQRSFNIIYGSNLELINLVDIEVDAILEKPESLDFDTSSPVNLLGVKHYYELTTNYPKIIGIGGLFEDDEIKDVDGNAIKAKDTVIGNQYASTYIEGAPDTDLESVFTEWSYPGSELPSGSYVTSSVLIGKVAQELDRNLIQHIQTADSSSFRVQPSQHMLVYDSELDSLRYKKSYELDLTSDKLVGMNGNTIDISSNNFEILDQSASVYVLDMEPNDTFVLHNGDLNIKIVAHNCFPAGTKITLEDGSYKNIEELTTDDILLTYNTITKKHGSGSIGKINMTTQHKLIKVVTADNDEIKSTPNHKFLCNGTTWTDAQDIKIGDLLLNESGEMVEVSHTEVLEGPVDVYHILDVKDDHTYFAERLLVHNYKHSLEPGPTCFSAGTRITLSNHDEKFIEDIVVGDEVLGWNGEELVPGKVTAIDHRHNVGSHADACKSLGDEPSLYTINETGIEFTPEHPFLTKEGWKSLVPALNQEPYLSQQEAKVLELGDFINVNGEWEEVKEIRVVRSNPDEKVYNITVEGTHSYIADGIIVHNK